MDFVHIGKIKGKTAVVFGLFDVQSLAVLENHLNESACYRQPDILQDRRADECSAVLSRSECYILENSQTLDTASVNGAVIFVKVCLCSLQWYATYMGDEINREWLRL